MTKAPHLPPKTCSVNSKETWGGVKWIVFITALSVFSGAVAAIVVLGWFGSTLDGERTIYLGARTTDTQNAEPQLEQSLEREINRRTIKVYQGKPQLGVIFYADAELGNAIMLSSDGWAVMHYAKDVPPNLTTLSGFDYQGVMQNVEKVVPDTKQNVLFIKFDGDNYPVSSFAKWDGNVSGEYVWAVNDTWNLHKIENYIESDTSVDIQNHIDTYALSKTEKAGSIVLDVKGNIVGFVNTDGNVEIGWGIEYQLQHVLSGSKISGDIFAISGYLVDGYLDPQTGNWKSGDVFVVTKTPKESALNSGDIVISFNGAPVKKHQFARQVAFAPESFLVTVLRADGMEELQVTQ